MIVRTLTIATANAARDHDSKKSHATATQEQPVSQVRSALRDTILSPPSSSWRLLSQGILRTHHEPVWERLQPVSSLTEPTPQRVASSPLPGGPRRDDISCTNGHRTPLEGEPSVRTRLRVIIIHMILFTLLIHYRLVQAEETHLYQLQLHLTHCQRIELSLIVQTVADYPPSIVWIELNTEPVVLSEIPLGDHRYRYTYVYEGQDSVSIDRLVIKNASKEVSIDLEKASCDRSKDFAPPEDAASSPSPAASALAKQGGEGGTRPAPRCPSTLVVRKLWDTSTCPAAGCPPIPNHPIQIRVRLQWRGQWVPEHDHTLTCQPSDHDPTFWRCHPLPLGPWWIIPDEDLWYIEELTTVPGWAMGTPTTLTAEQMQHPNVWEGVPRNTPYIDWDTYDLVATTPWEEPFAFTFYDAQRDEQVHILNIRNVYAPQPSFSVPSDPIDHHDMPITEALPNSLPQEIAGDATTHTPSEPTSPNSSHPAPAPADHADQGRASPPPSTVPIFATTGQSPVSQTHHIRGTTIQLAPATGRQLPTNGTLLSVGQLLLVSFLVTARWYRRTLRPWSRRDAGQ